jgi:hypothetical protein
VVGVRRSKRVLGVGGLSALAMAGPMVIPGATVQAGAATGPTVRVPQFGFSLTLPPSWTEIPLNGSDITSLLNSATHDDPTLANALSAEVKSATTHNIKVFAVGPVVGTSVPNVSIAVGSSAGAPSGKAFPPAAVVQAKISLSQAGARQIKTAVIHTGLGSTARVAYALPLKAATVYGVQYYAEHGSRVAILTVTSTLAATSLAAARTMAGNWHWR